MKMNLLKNFRRVEVVESIIGALSIGIIFCALNAKALPAEGSSYEMTCRMKAKEVAAESYRGCVTEGKKAQLDQIKADYQNRIRALKDEYSEELKKLSNDQQNSEDSTSNSSPAGKKKQLTKSKKSDSSRLVAKALPQKKVTSTSDELTLENTNEASYTLHPAGSRSSDDNSMDIPEPVPVDTN